MLLKPNEDGSFSLQDFIDFKPYNLKGDKLIDFSKVGATLSPIPQKTRRLTPDDSHNINIIVSDISYNTFVFTAGTYVFKEPIFIKRSGISFVGEGEVLFTFDGDFEDDIFLINFVGDKWFSSKGSNYKILADYVPVGENIIEVAKNDQLKVGDSVRVVRQGNIDWIKTIGMDKIPPRPDGLPVTQWTPYNMEFDRTIKAIESGKSTRITLDIPIVNSIDSTWGGGSIYKYTPARNSNCMICNISVRSKNQNNVALFTDNIEHVVVDSVVSYNADKFITIGRGSKYVTVKNCKYLEPSSKVIPKNRHAFHIQGQLCLIENCYAKDARHAISVDSRVCGPNVIYNFTSVDDHDASEPHHRWSAGTLFDNVESTIYVQNRSWMGSGHGWSGANYVLWNCRGKVCCQSPPTADNFAIGHTGSFYIGSFPENKQGVYHNWGNSVNPHSLYMYQRGLNVEPT